MNNDNLITNDEPEEISIQQFIEALSDESTILSDKLIEKLSYIPSTELKLVAITWESISAKRKLIIMQQMEELASLDILLSFEAFSIYLFDDSMEEVRRIALRILWDSENTKLIPKLLSILSDDPAIGPRGEAATVLAQFMFLGEVGKITEDLFNELENTLFSLLEDESQDDFIRQRCLETLGYSSKPEISKIIETMYFQNDDDDWLSSALLAMGRQGKEEWSELIIDKLEHSNSIVRIEAIKAAGELALPGADIILFDLIQDPEKDIRLATAWSLSEIGGKESRIAIENMLAFSDDDDETELIEQALENLNFNAELNEFNLLDFSNSSEDE
jgi:HEAT repeat protein